jgi:translation initiation factor IF-2
MRIHELAKEWGVTSKEVVSRLERIGIRGKKAQSSLRDDELARVKSELGLVEKPTVVVGTQHVVSERLVTERSETEEQLVTSREQTVEARLTASVIRRRTKRVEVVKREELPAAVPSLAAEALEIPPPPPAEAAPPPPPVGRVTAPPETAPAEVQEVEPVAPSPVSVTAPSAADGIGAEAGEAEAREAEAREAPVEEPTGPPAAEEPTPRLLETGAQPVRVLGRIDLRKVEAPARTGPSGPREVEAPGGPATGEVPPPEREAGRKAKKRKVIKKQDLFETLERQYRPAAPGKRPQKRRALPGREQRKTEITVAKASKRVVRISEMVSVGDLAKAIGVKAGEVVKKLMDLGMMATINQGLDSDTAALVAGEFDYTVENVAFDAEAVLEAGAEEAEGPLGPRPPVVTMMGHVDHGKTSLLDAIRQTNVTAGEAGGITQHIGAHNVEVNGRRITFLDTPGHEAFTAMRARGAKVTDVVVLVVAADDGIMPQTVEAINHARAADVPIVVAVNKIDRPEANVERVRQELANQGLVPEDWGGQTVVVPVSAKTKEGLPHLLEMLLLQADLLELRASPTRPARGTIVEAKLDRGRGPVATVLVQDGTLQTGDSVVCGTHYGRVRAMMDDRGRKVTDASPSAPVEILGLSGVVEAGDTIVVVGDETKARQVAEHRQAKEREAEMAKTSKVSLDDLYQQIQAGDVKDLRVVLKADVHGSVEALAEALQRLSTDEVRLVVLHGSVGGIIESDVLLASASNAIVIGFNVRPETKAAALAMREGVDIRLYTVIYDAVNDVRDALEGLLEPTEREKTIGRAEVRQTFTISGLGMIAGCAVVEGKITRGARARLLRDHVVIYTGRASSLRRFKDDVREVASGYECGIGLENYQDMKVGDVIEAYDVERVARRLDAAGAPALAQS